MKKIIKSEHEFMEQIKSGTYLVDFHAVWCGPCRMLEPIVDEISLTNDVLEIDVDEVPALAEKYGVMSIPTLIVFKDGKEVSKSIGFTTKEEILKML